MVSPMQASFLTDHPEIVAVAVALFGFFAARILSRLAEQWYLLLERSVRRHTHFKTENVDIAIFQPIFRGAVYYATLFFFLLLAVQLLGIEAIGDWVNVVLGYIPQLILAGIIIISGYLLGLIARGLVAGILGEKSQNLLPRFTQVIVVTAAVLTGLGQMAIDISFISEVIVILLGAFVGGLSLAFALGSKQLVKNLLARRELDRYHIGSHIRVGGVEGQIIEILSTAVVISSAEGTTTIPAARFSAEDVLLLHDDKNDGSTSGED